MNNKKAMLDYFMETVYYSNEPALINLCNKALCKGENLVNANNLKKLPPHLEQILIKNRKPDPGEGFRLLKCDDDDDIIIRFFTSMGNPLNLHSRILFNQDIMTKNLKEAGYDYFISNINVPYNINSTRIVISDKQPDKKLSNDELKVMMKEFLLDKSEFIALCNNSLLGGALNLKAKDVQDLDKDFLDILYQDCIEDKSENVRFVNVQGNIEIVRIIFFSDDNEASIIQANNNLNTMYRNMFKTGKVYYIRQLNLYTKPEIYAKIIEIATRLGTPEDIKEFLNGRTGFTNIQSAAFKN